MKIILAQGNPESRFNGTRHNVGFMLLDDFAAKHDMKWTSRPKFHADIAETTLAGEKVLLIKPSTFYNETGIAARSLVDFYKIDQANDLLVIHDDLALPLGTLRVRARGSDAGNNGIKSLNAHLGENYQRLRVGVWNEDRNKIDDVDFVLGKFSATEQKTLRDDISPKVNELLHDFAADTLEKTSHKLPNS